GAPPAGCGSAPRPWRPTAPPHCPRPPPVRRPRCAWPPAGPTWSPPAPTASSARSASCSPGGPCCSPPAPGTGWSTPAPSRRSRSAPPADRSGPAASPRRAASRNGRSAVFGRCAALGGRSALRPLGACRLRASAPPGASPDGRIGRGGPPRRRTGRPPRCRAGRRHLGVAAELVAVGVEEVEVVDRARDVLERTGLDAQADQAVPLGGGVADAEPGDDFGPGARDRLLAQLQPDGADPELDHTVGRREVRPGEAEHVPVPLQIGRAHV